MGRSQAADIDAFLETAGKTPVRASGGRGRLIFALDATMSRQPTWDRAMQIQAEMFTVAAELGGLDLQLVYFRGMGQFHASPWLSDSAALVDHMTGVSCRGGLTQIGRVLGHAEAEARRAKVDALVYVGDCAEESIDPLAEKAGRLGMLGVPAFIFHEGHEPYARQVFEEIARLSKGACCRFDPAAGDVLKRLLGAVAAYAAGGRKALESYAKGSGDAVAGLIEQMK